MAKAPTPSGKAPARYDPATPAKQEDLEAATRSIKEVQSTNRLIIVVLFASFVAIELALVIFAITTIVSDINSRDDLKTQVQVLEQQNQELNKQMEALNGQVEVLNTKIK